MNNKLKISLSFDDGRIDNYYNVLPILKKYKMNATIHVISGYIDHSYDSNLASSNGPCNINQLMEMKNNGFEISMHGDKHTTEIIDYKNCINKLTEWRLLDSDYGFSVPHSDESKLTCEFKDYLKTTKTKYVRVGKNIAKLSLKYKILYILSCIFHSSLFFNLYNDININYINDMDLMCLNSVVIKRKVKLRMIKRMIKERKDKNQWIILMFHSILDKKDLLYKTSDWSWSIDEFDDLCAYLSDLKNKNEVCVDSIINIVWRINDEL